MIAALSAARIYETVLFERQERLGRKLAQTGNGRCNISNSMAEQKHYYMNGFVSPALLKFGVENTKEFFAEIGLVLKEEHGGRLFPYSQQAGSVVDALRFALGKSAVELRLGESVLEIRRQKKGFIVKTDKETLNFDYVVICCGGAAAEKLGGTMDGYRLLRSLGHSITKLRPALVPLKTDNTYTKSLKGVKAEAKIYFYSAKGKLLREAEGDVLFAEYGLSGPAVMDVSRFSANTEGEELKIDLVPEFSERELSELLTKMRELRESAGEMYCGILNNRLGITLAKYAGLSPSMPSSDLTERDIERLAAAAKDFRFAVRGSTGFANAQVTRGGAELSEFNAETLESKLVPGLFAAGEVLDIDGECGGYNLQWAWSSGYIAGRCGECLK